MFNSIEEYGKAWVSIRKSQNNPSDEDRHRLEAVEDFLFGWSMIKASQALRDKIQLADIHMSRESSKVRG